MTAVKLTMLVLFILIESSQLLPHRAQYLNLFSHKRYFNNIFHISLPDFPGT